MSTAFQDSATDKPSQPSERILERRIAAVIAMMAVVHLLVAGTTLLSADEAYYWQWTRPLQLSYYDHPAMVAYWIFGGIHLLGETALGVRLFAVLGSLAVSALIWDTARLAFRSRKVGAWAALWLNATLLFNVSGVLITPDAPLLLFWSLTLWSVVRLINSGESKWIYAAGISLGLGALSKYTMALIVPGLLATFLLFPSLRQWLSRGHTWLAALMGLACTTPLLLWNWRNGGASFNKQLNHAFATEIRHPLKNLSEFLGGQVGLVTPLIFLLCLWGMGWALWAGWRRRRPEWFLLGATSLPILLYFIQHTQSGIVQAHWSGPAYLGGIIAAVGAWRSVADRRWLNCCAIAAPILGLVMTLVVFLQATTAILPIPIKIDATKRLGGWDELALAVQEEHQAHPKAFLFTQKHELAGVVPFLLPDHAPVFLHYSKVRPPFTSVADILALRGHDGIFITPTKDNGAGIAAQYGRKVTFLRHVVLHWRGLEADSYDLYLMEGYRGGAFTLDDGLDPSDP